MAESTQRSRDARKTERYRTDPEYRRAVLARQERYRRARGAKPLYPGGQSACAWCGEAFPTVDAGRPKKFCGAPCQRRAWKEKHRYLRGRALVTVTAWLPDGRHGRVTGKVSSAGGLLLGCPDCGCTMGIRDEAETKWQRWCPGCGLVLSIDAEEAEWVISETRSIRRSTRAA